LVLATLTASSFIAVLALSLDGGNVRTKQEQLSRRDIVHLALQLRIPFDVSFASDSLMGASPN
jgi:hypothetical protein